jgi:hypothetical protein
LLRYALEACGGPTAFDGLAITWFDQIQANGEWHYCKRYQSGTQDRKFFTPSGAIKVRYGAGEEQFAYQENLGRQLLQCVPEITTQDVSTKSTRDELYSFCANVLQTELGVPVRMVSFGPTELDKMCK